MRWKSLICTLTVAASLAGASGAWAGATDTLMDLLVQKGIITDQERKQLQEEMERDITRAMERQNKTKVASWLDQVKWSSDFRLRAEYFDNDDQSNTADRWR